MLKLLRLANKKKVKKEEVNNKTSLKMNNLCFLHKLSEINLNSYIIRKTKKNREILHL